MSRKPKNVSDEDAREITRFLLGKEIPQTQIAAVVKKSQSWVAGVKREDEIASASREEGRKEMQERITENVVEKASQKIAERVIRSNGVSLLPDDTN